MPLPQGDGVTYGLAAALAWGISTIAAARAGRRVGAYAALLMSQLVGAALLGLLAVVLRPPLADLHGRTLLGLVFGGLLTLLGWWTYYRALVRGPVGVVGAIAASYGGFAAVLAVLFLGEKLGPGGDAGVVLAVAGVGLAAAQSPGPRAAGETARSGILLAVVSAITYGAGSFAIGGFSARTGWLPAALVAYGSSVAALVLALPFWLKFGAGPAARRAAGTDALAPPGPGLPGLVLHHDRHPVRMFGNGSGTAGPAARRAAAGTDVLVLAPSRPAPAGLMLHHDRRPVRVSGNGSGTAGPAARRAAAGTDVLVLAPSRPAPAGLMLHHDRRPVRVSGNGSGTAGPAARRAGGAARPASPAVPAAVNGGPVRRWRCPGDLQGFAWSAVAGLAEGAALAAYSRGGQAGQVMVTSAVSSVYPVIPLAASLLLFRERLSWQQVLGVAVIVAGLVLVSLG